MNVSQPKLVLVGSSLQLGKRGNKLVSGTGVVSIQLPSGSLAPLSAGEPTASTHLSTRNYVDTVVPAIYNAAGTKLTNVKRIVLTTTANAGAWSVAIPNLGQTQILYATATAISGASASLPGAALAHIKAVSTSTISGLASIGTVITTILIGGSADLVAAPNGTQVYVDLLVQ